MLFLVLLAPILFNATWLIDTFLTQKFQWGESEGELNYGINSLIVISGIAPLVFSLIILPLLWYKVLELQTISICLLVLSGIVQWMAFWPYFKALSHERIENIIPALQTIPLFSYGIWVLLLHEVLPLPQVLLIIAIVIISMMFGWDFKAKQMNWKGVWLTVISSLCYASSYAIFKLWWGEQAHARVAFMWQSLGICILCAVFLLKRNTAKRTRAYMTRNGVLFAGLNITNELLYIGWVLIINFLMLRYHIAVVNTFSNGIQPILWFAMAYVAYRMLPKHFARTYSRKELLLKLMLCALALFLLWLFFYMLVWK